MELFRVEILATLYPKNLDKCTQKVLYIFQGLCVHTHTYVNLKILQKQPRLIDVDFHGYEHRFRMYIGYLMFMFSGWYFAYVD